MNELLIAFLLLLISALAVLIIIGILRLDAKVVEIDNKVSEFRKIDYAMLQKVVSVLRTINKNIRLGKLKDIYEIVRTSFIIANIYILFKKFSEQKHKK